MVNRAAYMTDIRKMEIRDIPYSSAISVIVHGNIDLSKLNPVEYLFDDIANAFEDNINRKSEITKSIIRMN